MKAARALHLSRRPGSPAAFTLLEVLVAVGITAVLAGFIVAVLVNVSGFWSRTSGRLSAEAQARYVLDQIALDLQGAHFRDDGNVWLAATIPANRNTSGYWDVRGALQTALKPRNTLAGGAGSLQFAATGNLHANDPRSPRFGEAGTWLRFFTTRRGANLTNATSSAPVAVGYQIVRRGTTSTPANTDRRYLLHRVEVEPTASLNAGYNLTAPGPYAPNSNSPAAPTRSPAEIRYPTLNSVVAENVIDLGVRLHVYAPNASTGALELQRIFPSNDSDTAHFATLPPRVPNAAGQFVDSFPEVVDVMVRVLTDEGARLIAGYEATPQRVFPPPGRNAQQYWWDLALAHSQVFTRRIVLPAKG